MDVLREEILYWDSLHIKIYVCCIVTAQIGH